ncbi:hypothetical protein IIV6-T1_433 [Invertebrate iridescent virus 6]|nr:hypothetical protein IIV6-T1_433 [Invertebrate iridescent virus 6]
MDKLISKKFSEFQYKYIADPDYKKEYDNNLKALHGIRLSHTTSYRDLAKFADPVCKTMISNEDFVKFNYNKIKKITNEVVNRTALANTALILMEIMKLETNQSVDKDWKRLLDKFL